jgi:hypothetical protein
MICWISVDIWANAAFHPSSTSSHNNYQVLDQQSPMKQASEMKLL